MRGPIFGVSPEDKIPLLFRPLWAEFENGLRILSSLGSLKTACCESLRDPGEDGRDRGGVDLWIALSASVDIPEIAWYIAKDEVNSLCSSGFKEKMIVDKIASSCRTAGGLDSSACIGITRLLVC